MKFGIKQVSISCVIIMLINLFGVNGLTLTRKVEAKTGKQEIRLENIRYIKKGKIIYSLQPNGDLVLLSSENYNKKNPKVIARRVKKVVAVAPKKNLIFYINKKGRLKEAMHSKGYISNVKKVKLFLDIRTKQFEQYYVFKKKNKLYVITKDNSLNVYSFTLKGKRIKFKFIRKICDNVKEVYPVKNRYETYMEIIEWYSSFFVIKTDDSLWSFGNNVCGVNGVGVKKEFYGKEFWTLRKVMDNCKSVRLFVHAGITVYAMKKNGDVYIWGDYYDGVKMNYKSGVYSLKPVKILKGIKEIDLIEGLALDKKDRLWLWETFESYSNRPNKPKIWGRKVREFGRDYYITKNNKLYLFGVKYSGNGEKEKTIKPVKVLENVKTYQEGLINKKCSDYRYANKGLSAALDYDGNLYVWGKSCGGTCCGKKIWGLNFRKGILTPTKVCEGVKNLYALQIVMKNGDMGTWIRESNEFTPWFSLKDNYEYRRINILKTEESISYPNRYFEFDGRNRMLGNYIFIKKDGKIFIESLKRSNKFYVEEKIKSGPKFGISKLCNAAI